MAGTPRRVTTRPVVVDEDDLDDGPVIGPWAVQAAAHKRRVDALAARFDRPIPSSARTH